MKAPFACIGLIILTLASCFPKEIIPDRAGVAIKKPERIQKSISHRSSTIFLQSRKNGIRTNDLMIEGRDGSLRYLSDNCFFIADFCISKMGILYYIEAGRDLGHTPIAGTRAGDFEIKKIDLLDEAFRIQRILPDSRFSEPHYLELSLDQRLLCLATRFGDIHVIDLETQKEINILPKGMDPSKVCGYRLSPDKRSFKVLLHTGTDESGGFTWESRTLPLP